jgi:hypothetical protein
MLTGQDIPSIFLSRLPCQAATAPYSALFHFMRREFTGQQCFSPALTSAGILRKPHDFCRMILYRLSGRTVLYTSLQNRLHLLHARRFSQVPVVQGALAISLANQPQLAPDSPDLTILQSSSGVRTGLAIICQYN